jgi:hypothetical protein
VCVCVCSFTFTQGRLKQQRADDALLQQAGEGWAAGVEEGELMDAA